MGDGGATRGGIYTQKSDKSKNNFINLELDAVDNSNNLILLMH